MTPACIRVPYILQDASSPCLANCTKCWCGVTSMEDVDVLLLLIFLQADNARFLTDILTYMILLNISFIVLSEACSVDVFSVPEPQLSLLWPFQLYSLGYTDNSCLTWILCTGRLAFTLMLKIGGFCFILYDLGVYVYVFLDVNTVIVSSNLHFFFHVNGFLLPSIIVDNNNHSHVDGFRHSAANCILDLIIRVGRIYTAIIWYVFSVFAI